MPSSSSMDPRDAPAEVPTTLRWYRIARLSGFVLLAAVTAYGVRELVTGETVEVGRYWSSKLPWLPLMLLLVAGDTLLEGVAWVAVYERFGIRARDRHGALVYISGNAGLLMPAQLGRLIRPDAMVAAGRGTLAECIKAEASVFVLDALSVVALLGGLLLWRVHPAAAPLGAAAIVVVFLYLGHRLADRLAGTRLGLPHGFWWNWKSVGIVAIELLGWVLNGLTFYILVFDLPGSVGVWDALFYGPGSSVFGVATGLPGGLGATESILGTALRLNAVPAAHLVVAVTAFRVITFWLRLAVGWIALAALQRRVRDCPPSSSTAELPVRSVSVHAK